MSYHIDRKGRQLLEAFERTCDEANACNHDEPRQFVAVLEVFDMTDPRVQDDPDFPGETWVLSADTLEELNAAVSGLDSEFNMELDTRFDLRIHIYPDDL